MNHDIKMDLRPGCEDAHWFWTESSGGEQLTVFCLLGVNLFGD
jgi:hypothetical protein